MPGVANQHGTAVPFPFHRCAETSARGTGTAPITACNAGGYAWNFDGMQIAACSHPRRAPYTFPDGHAMRAKTSRRRMQPGRMARRKTIDPRRTKEFQEIL
jgi:hypothetical protein